MKTAPRILNFIFWVGIFLMFFYLGYLSGKRTGKIEGFYEASELYEEKICHIFFDDLPYTYVSANCYKYFKIGKTI